MKRTTWAIVAGMLMISAASATSAKAEQLNSWQISTVYLLVSTVAPTALPTASSKELANREQRALVQAVVQEAAFAQAHVARGMELDVSPSLRQVMNAFEAQAQKDLNIEPSDAWLLEQIVEAGARALES